MKKLLALCTLLYTCAPVYSQQNFSSNLPLVIINTNGQQIVDEPKIMADMGIINNANGQPNNVTDAFNEYSGKVGIEIRGQSSQMFPMKSYGIELWDAAGSSVNKSLFGLPAESDWILYAPYNEKTLTHNYLAYTLSRQMGHWAANSRHVELVINGEYRGIYVFLEKIKRGSDGRVKIAKISKTDISGDKLTGGYIFSVDKQADGWFSPYKAGIAGNAPVQYTYVYPKLSNIVQQQKDYIRSYVDSFEHALYGNNFQDTVNGWRNFADERSFIDFLIINELSRNVDGYRISTYLHKNRNSINDKIFAGPVWDFDLAFKNADYCSGSDTTGWAWEFNNICPGDYFQVPFWWGKLSTDTLFAGNLLCRWKELRQNVLSQQNLYQLIDSVVSITAQPRTRHFAKWPVLGQYVWPNPQPIAQTYDEEISQLKNWLAARLRWIDRSLINTGACRTIPPLPDQNTITINPNPLGNVAIIGIAAVSQQKVNVQVIDILGRIMLNNAYIVQPGSNRVELNCNAWQAGVYTIKVTAADGYRFSKKVIKR
jgi:hypothetical protein